MCRRRTDICDRHAIRDRSSSRARDRARNAVGLVSTVTIIYCDACGLPIGPAPAPRTGRIVSADPRTAQMFFLSAMGLVPSRLEEAVAQRQAEERAETPPVTVAAAHLHDSCREVLQVTLSTAVTLLHEQAAEDAQKLRELFEGPVS